MLIMRNIIFVALAAGLGACQSLPSKYELHDSRFVGTWYDPETIPFDVMDYGEKTYLPDGKACGFILDIDKDGRSEITVYKSLWEVKNGHLLSTVLASNDPSLLAPPNPTVDDIVSINAHEMRLHMTAPATTYTYARYKLAVDRGSSLCELADTLMGRST